MDLRKYKYIKNTKPQYKVGKEAYAFKPYSPIDTGTLSGRIQMTSMENLPKPSMNMIPNSMLQNNASQSLQGLQNTKAVPVEGANKATGGGMKGLPITEGINFAANMINAFNTNSVKSQNELISEAGSTQGTINGIDYERQNSIDEQANLKQLQAENASNTLNAVTSGAQFGSAFGPIGTAAGGVLGLIGGLFGGSRRRKKLLERMREAQRQVNRTNIYNRTGANTQALQQNYYNENDDNSSGILYANKGKDMNKVWTPSGYRNGHINSMVGKGESIINFNTGKGALVTKGTKGVDNQPSSVHPDDNNVILGNDIDWTNGIKFADQAAPYTARLQMLNDITKRTTKYNDKSSLSKQTQNVQEREINRRKQPLLDALADISARQERQHQIENKQALGYYAPGKDAVNITIPDYSNVGQRSDMPWYQRIMPNAVGLAASLGQYLTYNNQPVSTTNTYRSNPYANRALQGLASLRYDIYPELQAIRNAERRGAYGINNMGGLTGGQRAAAQIANTIGTQRNIANTYANAAAQNNKYRQDYYTSLLNAGQQDRSARMAAAQQDYENYTAAHGAKYKNRDTAIANIINQMNNMYQNEFKYKTWMDTADFYRQRLANDRADLAFKWANAGATNSNPEQKQQTTSTTSTYTPWYSRDDNPYTNTWIPTNAFKWMYGSTLPKWNFTPNYSMNYGRRNWYDIWS